MKGKRQPGMSESSSPHLPRFHWQRATCRVCGQPFDYLGKRKPQVCRSPECRYRFLYKIDRTAWADYQPTFFEKN